MSRYAGSAVSTVSYDTAEAVRPATELESIRDQIHGNAKYAAEVLMQIEVLIAKLRGAPGPAAKDTPVPVPCGLLAEIRQGLQDADRIHSATCELLGELRSMI